MNVENGTEAAQFPEKEYINGIFVAGCRNKSAAGNTYFYLLICRHFTITFLKNETYEFSIFCIRNFVTLGTL